MRRRAAAKLVIAQAVAAKELAPATNEDVLLDALSGSLYKWLLIGTDPPAEKQREAFWTMVIKPNPSTK